MAGLASSAGAFFSFYIIVLAGFFAMAAFFRCVDRTWQEESARRRWG